MEWYPSDKNELNKILNYLLSKKPETSQEIHGLIIPHAGYAYSGEIAGKAFSLLKNKKINKALIFGPSHYKSFKKISSVEKIETPLGKAKITSNNFPKISYEHSVENQIPFLQKLNPNIEILPFVVGKITKKEALKISKQFADEQTIFIFSTDLSHFLTYEQAVKTDKQSIKIIENLEIENWGKIDACGIFPLLIAMNLCKIKNWKPKLIEYKNSGDITGDKNFVVGYVSFIF